MASKVCVCGQWCIALQLCSFPPGESTKALIKATTESPRELPANYITGSHAKDPNWELPPPSRMFLSGDRIEALRPTDNSRLSNSLSLLPPRLKCRVRLNVSNLQG